MKDVALFSRLPDLPTSRLFELDFVSLSQQPELTIFKGRRVVAFRKNLIEMTELEIKHAKVSGTSFCMFF